MSLRNTKEVREYIKKTMKELLPDMVESIIDGMSKPKDAEELAVINKVVYRVISDGRGTAVALDQDDNVLGQVGNKRWNWRKFLHSCTDFPRHSHERRNVQLGEHNYYGGDFFDNGTPQELAMAFAYIHRPEDMKCTECGSCCRHTRVRLEPLDKIPPSMIERRKKMIGLGLLVSNEVRWMKNKKGTSECIALDGNKCSIYVDRPRSCQVFLPTSPGCLMCRFTDKKEKEKNSCDSEK